MSGAGERIFEEAARWHLASARDDMDWDRFTRWLEADTLHRAAYDEIALTDAALDGHRPTLAPLADMHRRRHGFRWPLWAGGALAAALAAVLIVPQAIAPRQQTYSSGDTSRTVALQDGSQVVLGPRSKLTVAGSDGQKLALEGGAYFAIRHDPSRTLTVGAGGLEIGDIGTRFEVQTNGGAVRVEVSEGQVELRGDALGQPVRLPAGRRILFDPAHRLASVAPVSPRDVGEWREGRLSYDAAPLSLVVADLARYAGVSVALPGPLAARRFSGTLSIHDGDSAVRDLAQLMGLGCFATATLIAWSSAAEARGDPRRRIDIEATSLPEAIAELSLDARVSVGSEGQLPRLRTRPLHDTLTIERALARLLKGSGYVARRVGATAWRIERVVIAPGAPPAAPEPSLGTPSVHVAEIVVSATKRELTLSDAPVAAAVVPIEGTTRFDPADDTQRVAEHMEGLSLTSLGPGRNRMFLRGVADSPFGGKSQATVAVLLNDARLTYIAPDPDVRLIDVDRVELLKGPQGSLYGSGALGGIYRIVTHRADPSAFSIAGSINGQSVAAGELGGGGSLVVNLPLLRDVAALRLVGYGEKSPGWLNTGDRKDSNGSTVLGARGELGIDAGGAWRVDLTGLGQWLQTNDSTYTYRREAHARPGQLLEPHDNDLIHGSIHLEHEGATQIVFSTGYTDHNVNDRYDATRGADGFGLLDPQTLDDDAHYSVWDNEARASGAWGRLSWLGGLSHVEARQDWARVLTGARGSASALETTQRRETESALFGEATVPLAAALKVTLGGRLFHTTLHEHRTTLAEEGSEDLTRTGVTPSAAVAWHPREGRLVYLRYGSAVRQGGTTVAASGEVEHLDEDELMTLEGGWRETVGVVDLDLGLYHSWWRDIQSDVLLDNGLVETANVGEGAITGAELSLKAELPDGWQFDAGAMVQSALLTRDMSGLELHDRRLPVVPRWTLRGSLTREFALGDWSSSVSARVRYVGPGRLSFDPALDRPMGNYLETGLAFEVRRGRWFLAVEGRNLLNGRGDSFAYGNPLRILVAPQYIRQDPFSMKLSVTYVR